ncbi:hypothetical protein ACA910_014521 [Epithemia clementina (nom. ined.)]
MPLCYRKVGTLEGDEDNYASLIQLFQASDEETQALGTQDAEDLTILPTSENWLEDIVCLLHNQWPQVIPKSTATTTGEGGAYREKIVQTIDQRNHGLPCSYLMILGKRDDEKEDQASHHLQQVIGHGRLTECFESAGGNAAAASYILIDSKFRGQGWGRKLMSLLEEEARRLGYHYVYLWTTTEIPFYQKIGYVPCQRVSLKRECLKSLKTDQVQSLETMIVRKSQKCANKSSIKSTSFNETILLTPSSNADDADSSSTADDVWLRKRLVEEVGSVVVDIDTRIEELREFIQTIPPNAKQPSWILNAKICWFYHLCQVPWQAQIGPSCGLAALRMVREYFLRKRNPTQTNSDTGGDHAQQFPSLLKEARDRTFTEDGEVFNIHHLQTLAEDVCGMKCELWFTQTLTVREVSRVLIQEEGLFILAYDSNPRTRLPAQLLGHGAHYGIIVGILVAASTKNTRAETAPSTNIAPGGAASSQQDDNDDLPVVLLENISLVDYENNIPVDRTWLLVQHSLSRTLSMASWTELMESNQQLVSVDERKFGHKAAAGLDLKNHILVCKMMRNN